MATLSDLYSPVPHNVLVVPPLETGEYWDAFKAFFEELKGGWGDFEKTGYRQPFENVLNQGIGLVKGGQLDYASFAKALLSFAKLAPGGDFIVPIASGLIDFIFPYLFGGTSGQNKESAFFQMIMEQVEKMIDAKLEAFSLNDLNNIVTGLGRVVGTFQEQIQIAVGQGQTPGSRLAQCSNPPCTPSAKDLDNVTVSFKDTSTQFEANLAFFANPSGLSSDPDRARQTIMYTLPMYVTVATLHLSVYQGFIQFMEKWKNISYDEGYINSTKAALQRNINEYSQTASEIYKKYSTDYATQSNTKRNLNAYIRYNRVMITQVFDMVAMWPSLYPDDYAAGLDTDQTRMAFGDLIGPVEMKKKDNGIDDEPNYKGGQYNNLHFQLYNIYGGKVPGNDIFNYFYEGFQLNAANFMTQGNSQRTSIRDCYVSNFFATYKNYQSTEYFQTWDGSSYDHNAYYPGYINKCYSLQSSPPTGGCSELTRSNPTQLRYMNMRSQESQYLAYTDLEVDGNAIAGCIPLTYTPQYGGTSLNTTFNNQKIQAVYGVKADNANGKLADASGRMGFLYTLVDYNLYPQNIIGQPNDDGTVDATIQGFPAEKGTLNLTTDPLTKVFEPINSAAAVKLTQSQILALPITNLTSQNYQIRVRYASKSDITIFFHVETPNGDLNRGEQTLKNTENARGVAIQGNNGKYILQKLTDKTSIVSGKSTIYIQNNSNADLFLDRIEFVPVAAPPVPDSGQPINYQITGDLLMGDPNLDNWSDPLPLIDVRNIWDNPSHSIAFTTNLTGSITFNPFVNIQYTAAINLLKNRSVVETVPLGSGAITKPSTLPVNIQKTVAGGFDAIQLEIHHDHAVNFDAQISGNVSGKSNSFISLEDLNRITAQVHRLFNASQTELADTVSDYLLDQITMKVNALSDEKFGVEKKALRQLLNKAKQFIRSRNLLVGGDFEMNHGWLLGPNVTRVDSSTGDYLLLPPPTMYPSYTYQKIDESKLKANTRYTISGFIAQGDELEVVVSRYGKEIHKILHVPYEELLPISSDDTVTCCQANPCPPCQGETRDSHFFHYSIDVGALQLEKKPGIEVGFRIMQPNGFATISHIEVREERPLTDREIQKAQRKEAKWNKAWNKRQQALQHQVQPVIDAINALYQNKDWNGMILPSITYQDITSIVVPDLGEQTHWFMTDREGEYFSLQQQLNDALMRAYEQVETRNLIHSGDFTNQMIDYTKDWTSTGTLTRSAKGLLFGDPYTSITQTVELTDWNDEKEYKLTVSAQGSGTITVQHGEEELEIVRFTPDVLEPITTPVYLDAGTIEITVQADNENFLLQSIVLEEVPDDSNTTHLVTMGPFGQL
ncbi:insecticidal delta-endotoxin Cry8Ea1 family protein [Bacillus thuringiensis]|uniref:insecticidal delta-endotoxin Cry8Ea1 family protein n=1 Tax=Bacillus thuringiensis TaxID=1428 RepID=UPI0018CE5E0F|nr:insecticidal delta-endotoxin Cry8Ea1 family protein [Bacillus thuringiensis]